MYKNKIEKKYIKSKSFKKNQKVKKIKKVKKFKSNMYTKSQVPILAIAQVLVTSSKVP